MNIKSCLLSLLLLLPVTATANPTATGESLFSDDGYRIARYRSPTPDRVEGGRTLDTGSLQRLLGQNPTPALLNVQALTWRDGIFVEQEARYQIPGSRWLPNVGKGVLEPRWEQYFRNELERATGGLRDFPLVFYCRADCWMSWNAVRRAAEWGYSQLYWYPEGSDGWRDAGLSLERATPTPLQAAQ
ncbi:hypothetical protein [Marinobacterium aestuariivivens]|uniref:Rhodanese domain-containing protein n=1 Tax=Marinobacterium aestuariivivens TaxID=1698799 RepID=A0ABW2A904_9GAMM